MTDTQGDSIEVGAGDVEDVSAVLGAEPKGADYEGTKQSGAHMRDTMTAVLTGPDREGVKGPDPDEWGDEQLQHSPGSEEAPVDYEIKGPAHEKWGTPEEREQAEAERIALHLNPSA